MKMTCVLLLIMVVACTENLKEPQRVTKAVVLDVVYTLKGGVTKKASQARMVNSDPNYSYDQGYNDGCWAATHNVSYTTDNVLDPSIDIEDYSTGWYQGYRDCLPLPPSGSSGGTGSTSGGGDTDICLVMNVEYDEIAGQYFTYYQSVPCPKPPSSTPAKQ